MQIIFTKKPFLVFLSFCIAIFSSNFSLAQSKSKSIIALNKTFNASNSFIENIGQYGKKVEGFEQMGTIQYGYEGWGMPILFTAKGIIHLQRKIEKLSNREEEKLEKMGVKEAGIEHKNNITDRTITMEWAGANTAVEILNEEKTTDYHTYGLLTTKAYGYKKIIYKNLYNGIDVVYSFADNKIGFEYSLIVHPGADLTAVKMKYGGDVKTIKISNKGNLIVKSDIEGIEETIPISYYGEKLNTNKKADVTSNFSLVNNEIGFTLPKGYDATKSLVIDPFVSNTNSLVGANVAKAIDVDYDYAGNVYVAGGGSVSQTATASHSHAKYASDGTLLWTFNGVLTIPSWQAGYYYGGWVVDKTSGALYIGQGFAFAGFRVIRVSTTGLYDNYISTGNPAFQESWKLYWSCNNGNPQIICAGGGTTGNTNFAICSPPSTTLLAAANLTGSPVAGQDMTDLLIDPVTNSLYTIYASPLDPNTANKIYKHAQPYSFVSTTWSTFTGYPTVINELRNRPYLGAFYNDNSSNILAQNASYLFYWDGLNLKAFNKTTGAVVGTALTIPANTVLMQGGIVADACNNVFIGSTNGTIKVYNFNATVFDDAAAPDIAIAGYATKSVYDVAYDESKKLLYASGDGFVASFDVSSYCATTNFTLNIVPNCLTASATATVSPAPPSGSTVTYSLFIGNAQIATNITGNFAGLSPNISYTVVATINQACSGTQASTIFTLPGPTISFTQTNTTCGASTGSITALGSGTPGPYAYSLNGGAFQASGNFIGLVAGLYTLVVEGAGGCPNDTTVTILNSNGPLFTFVQTNADCGNNNGTVTVSASGGTLPYQYSINNGVTFQGGNFFTGLLAGQYMLKVKDAAGCINAALINITSSTAPSINAIPASATCGNNNGTISAFGFGGTAPLQYSINGNTFQATGFFPNLTPGSYTVVVKDANGCLQSTTVTVSNTTPPSVSATSTAAACFNVNGIITATGSGGVAPLQYNINGGAYQTSNIFTGLTAGVYSIGVQDLSGCLSTTSVTVLSVGGPTVSASSTVSACNSNTGSITATATGGTLPYQYSINGSTFQASNLFSALAAGNYVLFVKDAIGCISTATIIVSTTSGPNITAASTATSCSANDGTITITATGGAGGYTYSIDGVSYGASNVFTTLAIGNYTVYVKDANGCIKSTTVIIVNVSGLSLSVSTITTTSCSVNNGVITATATGGVAPLTYSINGTNYFASNIFNNLAAGNYTVYVKDANGCIVTKQTVVGSVSAPTFTTTVQQNATCGTASGVIRVTAIGGVAPLSYNIDGGAFQSINIFINVAAGVHPIIVKDATGCTAPAQLVTITNANSGNAIDSVTFRIVDVLGCIGEGRIKNLKGFPTGGGNNYEFSLDGGAFTTANNFRPVSVGVHTITARNRSSLCSTTKLAIIGSGTPATATATSTASACGASTGTITITGVGGTPYHASIDAAVTWVTFASATTFTGLAPGTYAIIIADDADYVAGPPVVPGACLTTIFVVVPSTGGPIISTSTTAPTCNLSNGTITVTGNNGTPPYTYNINGGAYSNVFSFSNLAAGNYAVTVKDNTGCITGANVTVANPSIPTVTAVVQSASCNLNNGSITATAVGGTAPLEYSINGTVFLSSNIFTGLSAGNYTLYVKDANQCFSTIPISIANSTIPFASAFTIAASCNNNDGSIVVAGSGGTLPFTFSLDGTVFQSSNTFNNLAAGFYTIYIKDARGCINTTGVSVGNIGAPTFTVNTTATKCNNPNGIITVSATGGTAPYQYSSNGGLTFQSITNILSGLAPGPHIVIVKDANGCIASQSVLVANLPGPHTLTATIIPAACGNANATVTLTAVGGTAPLQYSKDGITFQSSNIINALAAGSYTMFVRDANLCDKTIPVTVANLLGPAITATSSPSSCSFNDGTITILSIGGTLLLTFSKDGATYQSSNIFTGLAAGTYSIIAKDARGCADTISVIVNSSGGTPGVWTGGIDTDWFKAGNWTCGGVPTSTTDVLIPTGLSNYPIIPLGNALCHNINIQAGASVEVKSVAVFSLYGAITNTGVFDLLDGTLNITGPLAQVLAGSSILNHTIKNIVISNTASLSDALSVTGNVSFGGSNRIFATNDFLTLVSNTAGAASYNDITNNGTSTGNVTTGNVTIERYLFGQKSWRFLAAPVVIATSPTIAASWREGNNALAATGYGTQITGPTGPVIAAYGGELDYFTQRGSMKYFNASINNYVEIVNTTTTKIGNSEGYFVFVRGDRAAPNTTSGVGTPTTLRIKGEIRTGDQLYNVAADKFLSVGNPYPSAIDFRMITKSAQMVNAYTAWNPISAGSYNVGAFENYVYNIGTGHYEKIPGNNIRDSIQSGETIFIQNGDLVQGGSITIKETDKVRGSRLVSRLTEQERPGVNTPTLEINLYATDVNGTSYLADGIKLDFDNSYSNDLDNMDVRKVSNSFDNISIKRNGKTLVVERRKPITTEDTIFINLTSTRIAPYRFEIDPSVLSNSVVQAYLKDKFLQTETMLSLSSVTNIDFQITGDAGSRAADRFVIVFKQLPDMHFTAIAAVRSGENKVSIQWGIQNERNVSSYEIERSNNGNQFNVINTQVATNNVGANLQYRNEDTAATNHNNWYRIKARIINGDIVYSAIAMVGALAEMQGQNGGITIYPNPLSNKKALQIKFLNKIGKYHVVLIAEDGKVVHVENMDITHASETRTLNIGKKILHGHYELVIKNELGVSEIRPLIIF